MPFLAGCPSRPVLCPPDVATLRAAGPASVFEPNMIAFLGAGGFGITGGVFYWNPASLLADDGVVVIKPTAIGGGSPGRWLAAPLNAHQVTPPDPTLVHYWNCDITLAGAYVDSGSNPHNLSVTGAGAGGNAKLFEAFFSNGVYVRRTGASPTGFIQSTDTAIVPAPQVSIDGWVRPMSIQTGIPICVESVATGFPIIQLGFDAGSGAMIPHGFVETAAAVGVAISGDERNIVFPGEWVHIGITFDAISGDITLWSNGSIANVLPGGNPGALTAQGTYALGDVPVSMTANTWEGIIDDVRVTPTVLPRAYFESIARRGRGYGL